MVLPAREVEDDKFNNKHLKLLKMKKKEILIISSLVGLFIFINLSIGLKITQSGQKTELISIIKSAFADDENPSYCEVCGTGDCGLVMGTYSCTDKINTYKLCGVVCYTSSCNVSEQTTCP